jgi:hypothetical protein
MKILKAAAILVIGSLLGILTGCFVGAMTLRSDPNIVANGGHTAPGDGILVMLFILVSLVISIPLSAFIAWHVVFRKPKNEIP